MTLLQKSVGALVMAALAMTACSDGEVSTNDIVADGVVTDGELGHAIAEVISCAADDGVLVVPLIDDDGAVSFRVLADAQTVLDACYEVHFREVALLQAENA